MNFSILAFMRDIIAAMSQYRQSYILYRTKWGKKRKQFIEEKKQRRQLFQGSIEHEPQINNEQTFASVKLLRKHRIDIKKPKGAIV